ncbi:zf-HC2 domain-containing protein [Actinokineospora pegani]|uniref:zf-HC2 domain-containing protein n=1 Tax=Actinokineospora pegani TaxID=2654637 RepID=UPI0018D28AB5|nr:zf-HC2 domain-containing protein [Actinokineospora pegani]
MDCLTCREALSARLDGEAEPVEQARTDDHLAECQSCRGWQARAARSARLLRVRPVPRVPDLTARILDEAPLPARIPGLVPRTLLGLVAVAQLGLALAQIFGTGPSSHGEHGGGPLSLHLFNESTAWNLALGIGFYWAAWRPRGASGLLPVLTGFVVVLLGYSAHDLITGAAPLSRVLGHALVLAGWLLLIILRRALRDPAPGDKAAEDTARRLDLADEPPLADPGAADQPGTGRHLRPAGRHHAA